MPFIASARRYRPQQWADVLDQPATVRILRNAVRTQRIASAYLFSGQRGCGKTTIARLLAKSLNCLDVPSQVQAGQLPEPCGVCAPCMDILAGRDNEVIEMDAASNRGIDDIRALQRLAQQQPRAGAWRVVILDEAHALTKDAQGALLALLEDPPAQFLPIFCTTDAEKILPTILSRCSTFLIRPLSTEAVMTSLRKIFSDAQTPVDDSVLFALARVGNGSLRDVQQIADQLILCADGARVDDAFAESQAGLPTVSLFRSMAGALTDACENGPAAWFEAIEEFRIKGLDLRMLFFQVVPALLRDFRVAIVSRGLEQPVVPYDSGISHTTFEANNFFSHADLDVLFQAWDAHAEYFGQLDEKVNFELFFLSAWDRLRRTNP